MQIEAVIEGFTQKKTDLESEKRSLQTAGENVKNRMKEYFSILTLYLVVDVALPEAAQTVSLP